MADLWYRKDAPRIAMIYGEQVRWDSSEAELLLASKFDLHITAFGDMLVGTTDAQKQKFNDNLKRLHDMNPRLKILYSTTGACEAHRGSKYFSDDCFLRTPEGDYINSWPGACLLNLSNPKTIAAYKDVFADRWPHDLAVDGIYIDTMGGSFDHWAVELESKKKVQIDANCDGLPDDNDELDRLWIEGKRQILAGVREVYGDEPYILVNSTMYSDYAKPYADGTIFEGILDHIALPEAYTKYSFDQIISEYLKWCKTPSGRPNVTYIDVTPGFDIDFVPLESRPVMENNRTWLRGYESLQKMRFGLAFSLLGDGHFTFQLHTRWLGEHWWYQEYDIPIGKPLGEYYKHEDGTYRRDYENAIVVLNNTYHDIEPHFDQTMRDGTTSWVGKDFFLPSKDGRIYVRVGL